MALVTDTGSFHFPNTSERTLKVASELVKAGARPSDISEAVYNSYSWSRLALMQMVIATMRRSEDGSVAWMRQTLKMVEESGALDGDNNGFVNIPLTAAEIRASFYMREVSEGEYRVSLRSKGDIDVARIAESFGGGGHKNAAGCRVEGDWDELEMRIADALSEAVADRELIEQQILDRELSLA